MTRISRFGRDVLFVVLVSAFLTAGIHALGQQARRARSRTAPVPASAPDVLRPGVLTGGAWNEGQEPPPAVQAVRAALVARGRPGPVMPHMGTLGMGTMQAVAAGNMVTVTGSARVQDSVHRDLRYIWDVQVFRLGPGGPKDRAFVRGHRYLEKVFGMPEGQDEMRPEFADSFPLPAGTYEVHLSLYSVRPGFDFSRFRPEESLHVKTFGAVGTFQRVTVAGE
jgi:hypothetical protein